MSSKSASRPNHLDLRRCFGSFPTGVAVITYDAPDGPRGVTVNSFVSVSLDPALVLVSIASSARARSGLQDARFAVNVLGAHQHDVAMHFAGRPSESLRVPWHRDTDVPRLRECAAWLQCAPWRSIEAGDHILFIGEVVAYGHDAVDPLIFHAGTFRTEKPASRHSWLPSPVDRLDRGRDLELWSDAGSSNHVVPA
ncbi:flavin reductase family protein (plasmid) [Rhodococcus sp. USK10]|uniref:flavin reductase family protein n=1 Tax=Rhodococcus sp. USK10 TaxID=2789739 RepID=UPI001C5CEBB7|nr:flavin reductase family protein [Rhodococcus sp. USK10]QYB00104.1 flavin reductase family protein [Rhodococcus sp. USK10]